MMGQFEAQFPTDRQYAKNHMWAQQHKSGFRFGFTNYAVRLLQDVYFLDWTVDCGSHFNEGREIGSIESSKAESSLYCPMTGLLTEINNKLLADPSAINIDGYGEGWLFEIEGDSSRLLSPEGYMDYLKDVWDVTQRTIKGQLS